MATPIGLGLPDDVGQTEADLGRIALLDPYHLRTSHDAADVLQVELEVHHVPVPRGMLSGYDAPQPTLAEIARRAREAPIARSHRQRHGSADASR